MGNILYLYFTVMVAALVLIGMQIFWLAQHWGILGAIAGVLLFPILTPLFPFISRFVDGVWPIEWLSILGFFLLGTMVFGIFSKTSKPQQ